MINLKHFTILEIGADSESPMVGTIDNITNNPQGIESFTERLQVALCEHFDFDKINHGDIPDLFCGSPYDNMDIEVDGNKYQIRILETWIY